jgi:hypothetical protein
MAEMATALQECDQELAPETPASSYPDLLPQIVVPVATAQAAGLMEPSTATLVETPSAKKAATGQAARVVPRAPVAPRRSPGLVVVVVVGGVLTLSGVGYAIYRAVSGSGQRAIGGDAAQGATTPRAADAGGRARARELGTSLSVARDAARLVLPARDGAPSTADLSKRRPPGKRKLPPRRIDAGSKQRDPRLNELKPFPKDTK